MKDLLKNKYFWGILILVAIIILYGCKNGWFSNKMATGGRTKTSPSTQRKPICPPGSHAVWVIGNHWWNYLGFDNQYECQNT